jgi:DNA-binding transcriptional ArsR family regulator
MTAKKRGHSESNEMGRFAYEGLDRALHEKARLGMLTSLVAHPDGLKFGELRALCSLTDGDLSRHLDVLREAGLVEVWKGFERRRPQTLVRLTSEGRKRFIAYLEELERVVRDALPKAESTPIRAKQLPPGWQPAS